MLSICFRASCSFTKQTLKSKFLSKSLIKRFLFTDEILGIDSYKRQRLNVLRKAGEIKEVLRLKIDDHMKKDASIIYKDDLFTMVYLADDPFLLKTVKEMVKRYHVQTRDAQLTGFVFGPLVMRMFHCNSDADTAFSMFMDQELEGFFKQASSAIVLLDLLFEQKQYERVIEAFNHMRNHNICDVKYPMDPCVLFTASCLKLNTSKALELVKELLFSAQADEMKLTGRCVVFAAWLALKQNDPESALDFLLISEEGSVDSENLPTPAVVNVKAIAYARLGRIEEAIEVLSEFVSHTELLDSKDQGPIGDIYKETIDIIRNSPKLQLTARLREKLDRAVTLITELNITTTAPFEPYLFREVVRQRHLQDGYKHRPRKIVYRLQHKPLDQPHKSSNITAGSRVLA